jgi:hypothetical protein
VAGSLGITARGGSTARLEDHVVVRILVRGVILHAVLRSRCVPQLLKRRRDLRGLVGKV